MRVFRRMVTELGKTIVLVVHDINFASCHSDRIVALKDGRIVRDGPPSELITTQALHDVYDMEIPIETVNGNRIGVYFS